jgi:hypothetical protein
MDLSLRSVHPVAISMVGGSNSVTSSRAHALCSALLMGGALAHRPNCRVWYGLEAAFVQFTIVGVDVILMLRGRGV